jgi:hypothetical protein
MLGPTFGGSPTADTSRYVRQGNSRSISFPEH